VLPILSLHHRHGNNAFNSNNVLSGQEASLSIISTMFDFLRLPIEIRNIIYRRVFEPENGDECIRSYSITGGQGVAG